MDREVRRRLAVLRHVEEVSGNVAMTCCYFGISRPTYYTWLRGYETEGVDGLRDRSRRPRSSPNATRAEVVEKIIHLRQNYHFGPDKIRMYLQRYHDIEISKSGVWRILKRLDMGRLPASPRYKRHDRRWKRYEKRRPGHRVQIDVKFVEPRPLYGYRTCCRGYREERDEMPSKDSSGFPTVQPRRVRLGILPAVSGARGWLGAERYMRCNRESGLQRLRSLALF
ncbi:helix-turn-helix domain-containing protein [Nocardia pseudovaccinii]|uniref:helix-turn-helix domain-containing protein n=1 Tax=Nocardia pseudovaccinii TaxID=189540 RepID=UPI003D8AA81F